MRHDQGSYHRRTRTTLLQIRQQSCKLCQNFSQQSQSQAIWIEVKKLFLNFCFIKKIPIIPIFFFLLFFVYRFLQFNLFNSTGKPGRPDSLTLYDGDIYNVTVEKIEDLYVNSNLEKKLFRTQGPSLSVKLFATGASSVHGFIAEVITLPISAIGFSKCESLYRFFFFLFVFKNILITLRSYTGKNRSWCAAQRFLLDNLGLSWGCVEILERRWSQCRDNSGEKSIFQ